MGGRVWFFFEVKELGLGQPAPVLNEIKPTLKV